MFWIPSFGTLFSAKSGQILAKGTLKFGRNVFPPLIFELFDFVPDLRVCAAQTKDNPGKNVDFFFSAFFDPCNFHPSEVFFFSRDFLDFFPDFAQNRC
jgi:hypothetical protein